MMAEKKVFCKDCTIRIKPVKVGLLAQFKGEEPPKAEYEEFADGYRCLPCATEFREEQRTRAKKTKDEFLGNTAQ